jgi:hypothetical protein
MSYFVPAVHASFFIPFRCGLPFHYFTNYIFSKEFELPLQPLHFISLINRQKPRHFKQAFRLHCIPPQPLLLEIGIASFSPAACLPRTSKSPPPFSGARDNILLAIAYGPCPFLQFIRAGPHMPFSSFLSKSAISLSNPHKRSLFTAFRNLTPELHSIAIKQMIIIFQRHLFAAATFRPAIASFHSLLYLLFPTPVLWYTLHHYYPY